MALAGLALACGVAGGGAAADPIPACALPAQVASPVLRPPPPDEVHADAPTAAYLLSLIWSPEECRNHGDETDGDVQCRANRFGFTVHGLWPNGVARYHPRYCRPAPPVDAATMRANLCMTPSAWLIQHEWAAHGVCGWPTPAAYFARERALRTALDVPDLAPNADGFLTAGEVRDAFVRRNPAIPRDGLDVHVGRDNRLEEVRVCYDVRFRYAACLSGTGAPDAAPIPGHAPGLNALTRRNRSAPLHDVRSAWSPPAVRALVLTAAFAGALLPVLAGCASYDPHDRRVNARFARTDGRRLRVQFRLDRKEAEVRGDKLKPVTLPATGAASGRSYAGLGPDGGAYSLDGLGDRITWRAPGAPPVTCQETH